MSALLEVRDLQVRFRSMGPLRARLQGVRDPFIDAVCGISFDIHEGETLGLVGESGSGKSTVARAVNGLLPAHAGSVRFQGQELTGLGRRDFAPFRRDISLMFQDPAGSLSPRMTVRSLVTEPFRIHGYRDRDLKAEASRLLELVGLGDEFAGRFPHQLSGGQARRVGLARALALDPKLILADEPTAGLDVSVQGEALNLLARIQDQLGVAILIITHNLNVVRHITDRMAIMYLGRFVEQGMTDDIFERPHHPYTEALLSASPEPDPDMAHDRIELKGEIPSLMNRPTGCEFHTRCPYATDRCSNDVPAFTQAGEGHSYTCHFPLNVDTRAARAIDRRG